MSGRPTKFGYCPYPATKERCHGKHFLAFYICGAHWRNPANTTELSVCGGDAALRQITLTTCSYYYKLITCVSVRLSDAENSARSAMERYCRSRNFLSSASSCCVVNGVRGFRFVLCLRRRHF